jgi:hypothetical protein
MVPVPALRFSCPGPCKNHLYPNSLQEFRCKQTVSSPLFTMLKQVMLLNAGVPIVYIIVQRIILTIFDRRIAMTMAD